MLASLVDVAIFLLITGGVPGVALGAGVLIAVLRDPRWWVWLGTLLALGEIIAWLVFWYFWGKAFDYADANQPVPQSIRAAEDAAVALCAAGVGLLATGSGIALFQHARARHAPRPRTAAPPRPAG